MTPRDGSRTAGAASGAAAPRTAVATSRANRVRTAAAATAVAAVVSTVGFQIADPFDYHAREQAERLAAAILARDHAGTLCLMPGARGEYLGHEFAVGPDGLRNPAVEVPKPTDVFRIAVLGDSVPFGWGVAEDRCFPRVLERWLRRQRAPGARRVEVVNAGVPGFGVLDVLGWWRDRGERLSADLVLHCVIRNDVVPDLPVRRFLPSWARRIRLLRFAEIAWAGATAPEPEPPPEDRLSPLFLDVVARVRDEVERSGARYVLLDTLDWPRNAAGAAERGLRRVSFPGDESFVLRHRVARGDLHPNAAGHAAIACAVFPELVAIVRRLDPMLLRD